MAKEMMIVFVYDTECCQDEADDPFSAVLYFHPGWVSDTQKVALCGQLMGTANFLRATFGKPKIIALQNGKFVLKEFGRFILAVGTDRNIAEPILEHRSELLSSLLRMFHRDIQTIYDQFTASGQYKNISEKLYHIFETFLPILQYNGNIYQNMPMSKLPKSASNVFLEAMHTLQSCQQSKEVLGGTILYHNKVIATQLSSKLTKNLLLTDPFRIKSTAESIPVNFHVPVGCQLIIIYIPVKHYEKLRENANRLQAVGRRHTIEANGNNGNSQSNAAICPFQLKKKLMKRDKSIVFTNIPEETAVSVSRDTDEPSNPFDTEKPTIPTSMRPNHLPLRFKNITSKDIPESGFSSSITFDEHDSFPQFIGRTSVCSTPMTENKVLQGNILPICAGATVTLATKENEPIVPNSPLSPNDLINSNYRNYDDYIEYPEEVVEDHEETREEKILRFRVFFDRQANDLSSNFVVKPFEGRRYTVSDIRSTIKKFTKQLMDYSKYNSIDQSNIENRSYLLKRETIQKVVHRDPDEDSDFVDDSIPKLKYRTLCDPAFPFFNRSGAPISQCLFERYVNQHLQETQEFLNEMSASIYKRSKKREPEVVKESEQPVESAEPEEPKAFEPIGGERKSRLSLTLPLKSLTSDLVKDDSQTSPNAESKDVADTGTTAGTIFDPVVQRRKLTGLQLTPLITKLSILAMKDERSSGFSSWDTTPGIEMATPLDGTKLFRRQSSATILEDIDFNDVGHRASTDDTDDGIMQRVELFICGQNNMTMFLLLEENSNAKKEIVQNMFDICISKLPKLETSLNQILNVNVAGARTDGAYSFLNIDPEWDTLDRGGPWSNNDYTTIEHIRHDFNRNSLLCNMILRSDDSVIYGHQNNGSNVFYKKVSEYHNGLPPPADTLGNISKYAHNHLERDHTIMLF